VGSLRSVVRGRRAAEHRAPQLFYAHGVRAVGVDRIVAEAQVTRMKFYRHFPSKEDLVEAYLRTRAERGRAAVAALRAATPDDPRAVLAAIARGIADDCAVEASEAASL
jgi:AcrR family transcriptional regulator